MVTDNINIEALNLRIIELRKQQDELLKQSNIGDFVGYLMNSKEIRSEMDNLEYQIQLHTPVMYEKIPSFSDKMELSTFISFVECDIYTDIEGIAYYSDGYRMTNKPLYPSDIKAGRIRSDFKYIVWLEEPNF